MLELRRVENPATPDELDRRDGVNALPLTRIGDRGFTEANDPSSEACGGWKITKRRWNREISLNVGTGHISGFWI